MRHMEKTRHINTRITERERAKLDECAAFMGISRGEFMRRSMQVMLMVMGDKQSERAIRQILSEAVGRVKMGAGLAPVPPTVGRVTGTHLLPQKPRGKRKSGK